MGKGNKMDVVRCYANHNKGKQSGRQRSQFSPVGFQEADSDVSFKKCITIYDTPPEPTLWMGGK